MYYNDYYNDCYANNASNKNFQCNENRKNNHCYENMEEPFYCHPSYYNEEKIVDKKENCWHGHFKICPCKQSNKDYCDKEYNNQECENDKPKGSCGCRHTQRRCCFCNLFRNW